MKAERRHELKTNTLDKVLTGAPDASRKYGGMALLVVLAALAAYALIRYRISSAREAERLAVGNLTTARNSVGQLGQIDLFPLPPQQKAEYRKRLSDDARNALDQVTQTADDPRLLAEAILAKGDLNWALANLDELPGAATQQALRMDSNRNQLLGDAEASYGQVLSQYGNQQAAVIAARFGLGAVYENLGSWDKARTQYEAIRGDSTVADAYKTQATIRLEKSADWSQPVLLAAATQAVVEDVTTPRPTPATHPVTATAPTTHAATTTKPAP